MFNIDKIKATLSSAARKAKQVALALTDLEMKVEEATNAETWGPPRANIERDLRRSVRYGRLPTNYGYFGATATRKRYNKRKKTSLHSIPREGAFLSFSVSGAFLSHHDS